ncbi:MAG: FMN-binding protein [Candidatus Brocadiae bacterium]|nr:FMN-binding protein [Candidatus Brocadiia bacterium]
MTDAVRFPLVLGLISLFSAAGLAVSYQATYDRIRYQVELKKARGLSVVLGLPLDESPDAKRPWEEHTYPALDGGQQAPPFVVYEAEAPKSGRFYAAEGKAQGYSSKVHVVVAAHQASAYGPRQFTVKAITVVGQLETPGLGSRCTEPEFQREFERLPEAMLDLITNAPYRDPNAPDSENQHVAAIPGATITSSAVIAAVHQALARIRHHVGQRAATR